MLTKPLAPPLSRTPSTSTVTQSRPQAVPSSPRQPIQRSFRHSLNPYAPSKLGTAVDSKSPDLHSPTDHPKSSVSSPEVSNSSSSSSSDSDDVLPMGRSRLFPRRPNSRFHAQKKSPLGDHDEESSEEDSPTFLPFAGSSRQPNDPSATLREAEPRRAPAKPPSKEKMRSSRPPDSEQDELSATSSTSPSKPTHSTLPTREKGKSKVVLSSSASSAASSAAPHQQGPNRRPLSGVTISPRHRTELARLQSPGRLSPSLRPGTAGTGKDVAAQQSDGTPSMGSSFSDLDDTSITQSALEEALASNLRHGGASRLSNFSTLGNAFRSRYGQG
jgi:hypothetical protein